MNRLALMLDNKFEILTFTDEFPTSILPWQHQGYHINFVRSSANGFTNFEEKLQALTAKISSSQSMNEEIKSLSKTRLEAIFNKYTAAYKKVFRKGSTVADVDKLDSF